MLRVLGRDGRDYYSETAWSSLVIFRLINSVHQVRLALGSCQRITLRQAAAWESYLGDGILANCPPFPSEKAQTVSARSIVGVVDN